MFTGGDDVMAIHFMSLKRCEDNDRRYDDDDVSILTVNVNCKSVCCIGVCFRSIKTDKHVKKSL